jgi:hypothetical protein
VTVSSIRLYAVEHATRQSETVVCPPEHELVEEEASSVEDFVVELDVSTSSSPPPFSPPSMLCGSGQLPAMHEGSWNFGRSGRLKMASGPGVGRCQMMTPPMMGTIVLELSSPVVVVQVFPVNAGRVSRDALEGNEVMTDVSGRVPKGKMVFELVGDSVCVDAVVRRLCWFVVCSVTETEDVEDVSESASAVDDTGINPIDSDVPVVAASKVLFARPVVLSDTC